ncbi:unnamed protein product [Miscanthus lutarioriparius]|uniref:Uncharacterized protein n=1 Tax=Miscanthus lutarioriparius TaxID=422564 RepID=A0A811NH78_9POAL|nr:unnamed protein product [Miscanthus lutarioriparius]
MLDLDERVERALGSLPPLWQSQESSEGEQLGAITFPQPPLTTAIRENHFASPSIKVPSSAHLELLPPRVASGSLDHGKGSTHWGADFGAVYTITPEMALVIGATPPPKSTLVLSHTDGSGYCDRCYYPPYPPYPPTTPFPKVEFHKFDGSNPHLWIKRCETYFDVYQTDPGLWEEASQDQPIKRSELDLTPREILKSQ